MTIPVDRAAVRAEFEKAAEAYRRAGPENIVSGTRAKARAEALKEILDGDYNVRQQPLGRGDESAEADRPGS